MPDWKKQNTREAFYQLGYSDDDTETHSLKEDEHHHETNDTSLQVEHRE
jgi:hypothetical protein